MKFIFPDGDMSKAKPERLDIALYEVRLGLDKGMANTLSSVESAVMLL